MTKDFVKAFIILTLVFEFMTIAGLGAFFHIFGISCIAVAVSIILFHIFGNIGSSGDGSVVVIPEGV